MFNKLKDGYCGLAANGTHLHHATVLNRTLVRQFQSHASSMMCQLRNTSCIVQCPMVSLAGVIERG